jgi:hypothetical protein
MSLVSRQRREQTCVNANLEGNQGSIWPSPAGFLCGLDDRNCGPADDEGMVFGLVVGSRGAGGWGWDEPVKDIQRKP